VLGFYLYIVHVLTAKALFLNKALFKDRNFVLSAIMYFAFGFLLLPTIALTRRCWMKCSTSRRIPPAT